MRADFGGVFSRPPTAVFALMVATAVMSIAGLADGGRFGSGGVLVRQLFFSPSQVLDSWKIWTPFTYLFLVLDPWNLVLYEIFGLWMFASPLERQWGTRRFLYYFFGTGSGAAVITTLLGMWSSALRVWPAQGGIVSGEAIFLGWILSNWTSTVLLLFVLPVRAPYLLLVSLGIPALYIIMGQWEPFVPALFAMGIGYLMLKRNLPWRRASLHLRAWWIERQLRRKSRHLRVVPPPDRENKNDHKFLH